MHGGELTVNRRLQFGHWFITGRLHVLLEFVPQIHQRVELVDDRARVRLQERELALLLALHFAAQIRATRFQILK